MSKQGKKFLAAVMAILLIAIASYFLRYLLHSDEHKTQTVSAIIYEVGDGLSTSGFVTRAETVLTSDHPIVVLSQSEGAWVSAGQTVAYAYLDEEAQKKQTQLNSLQDDLAQLQYAYDYASSTVDTATLEANISQDLMETAMHISRRDMTSARTIGAQTKSLILRRYAAEDSAENLWNSLTALKAEIAELEQATSGSTEIMTAPHSGYFSGAADGYEEMLNPDKFSQMTVAQFQELEQTEPAAPEHAYGKLITTQNWYYVTVVDAADFQTHHTGDTVNVSFSYDFYENVQMQVQHISPEEDGKCIVVLQCDEYLYEATKLRYQSADLIFGTYSGLRVPKDAIYYQEETNHAGVYILENEKAVWKNVTLLYDNGESYIVELDKRSTENLWPGDEIILTGDEIYDGKVME